MCITYNHTDIAWLHQVASIIFYTDLSRARQSFFAASSPTIPPVVVVSSLPCCSMPEPAPLPLLPSLLLSLLLTLLLSPVYIITAPIMSCNLIVACLIEMDNKLKSIVSPRPTHLPGRATTLYYILPIMSREQLYARIMSRGGDFKVQDGKWSFTYKHDFRDCINVVQPMKLANYDDFEI